MELCYKKEMLLLILYFGILVRWYFLRAGHSVLIVGGFFFFFFNSAWRMMTVCLLVSQKMEQKRRIQFQLSGFLLKRESSQKFSHCLLSSRGWRKVLKETGISPWPSVAYHWLFKDNALALKASMQGWASRMERKMPGNSVMLSWIKPRSLRMPFFFFRDSNCWGQSLLQLSLSQQTNSTNATNPPAYDYG